MRVSWPKQLLRSIWSILLIGCMLVLAGCDLARSHWRPGHQAEGRIITAQAAAPPTLDVVFVVDQSQSMRGGAGEPGTDPDGLRFGAVKYAIDNLRLKGTAEQSHRVGLVQFGSEAPAQLSHTLVRTTDQKGLEEIGDLLTPRDLTWTNFAAALRQADTILEQGGAYAPNHCPAIVIFTDGSPKDARKLPQSQYFAEIEGLVRQRLSSRGCSVYVVAVDATGNYWQTDRTAWESVTGGRAYSISSVDALKGKFNDIVRDMLQLPELPRDELSAGGTSFDVGAYLDQLEFHIFGPYPRDLRILDPSALPSKTKEWHSPDYSIVTISRPTPGKWTYRLPQSASHVTVYRNEVPVRPRLVLPRPVYPVGKPIQIIAAVQYANGEPLQYNTQYPLRVTARIDSKGQSAQHFTLNDIGNGIFESPGPVPGPMTAQRLSLDIVLHAGTTREYSSRTPVDLVKEPYFLVALRTGGYFRHYSDTVDVSAELYEAGKSISGGEVFQSPTAAIRAQLDASPLSQASTPIWLDPLPQSPGVYTGCIPARVDSPGRYAISYEIGATDSRTGRRIQYSEPVAIVVAPTWLDKALVGGEIAAWIILSAAALLLILLVLAAVWAYRLPRMQGGRLTVTYHVASPATRGATKTPARQSTSKPAGLDALLQTATPAHSPGRAPAATPGASQRREYQLYGRFLLGRPGRLLFVHRRISALPPLWRSKNLARTDMSKRCYVIRYFQFPFFRKSVCDSGKVLTIGEHTLDFK